MHSRSRFFLLAIAIALFVVPVGAASAQDASTDRPIFDRPICEPPISTCNSRSLGPLSSSVSPLPECPLGYECVCVPGRAEQDDCAVEVCIRDHGRECDTACDCPAGIGCFDGQCTPSFAPVFCCDSPFCPAGQQCQDRDGETRRCEMPGDPMCEERREKAAKAVAKVVDRYSACREDRDCVRIDTSTQCMGTCGDFVNRDHAPVVERWINKIDRKACTGYREAGCPFLTPACLLQRPRCVENRCTGVRVDFVPLPRPIDPVLHDTGAVLELAPTP